MASARRIGGWGFVGETFAPSAQLLAWLGERIGPPGPPLTDAAVAPPAIAARPLPWLGAELSTDPLDRLAHARGMGLADVIRVRSGHVPALPDGVCRPHSAAEVEAVVAACAASGVRLIPWGGGTSVTGGVNVLPSPAPVVTLDLERLAGLSAWDEVSELATLGAGTAGPALEAALAGLGMTLGHYPQSWELATLGGWVAARSSGQESVGYGRIEDLVAGLELVAPAGCLRLQPMPASAAGPDLRQLVLGSEGRLGVITEVTVRVRPRPASQAVEAALVPSIELGLDAVRALVRAELPLTVVRLSDAPETQVAMAVGLAQRVAMAPLVNAYLRLRGIGTDACLMLVGAAGEREQVDAALAAANAILRPQGAVILGRGPGRTWQRDRFRHPYLREALLDHGYATDTLETALPWSRAAAARQAVAAAIAGSLGRLGERVAVLCHVSHPYRDGASLYFTFFFRPSGDPAATLHRWALAKRAANDALIAQGATMSHHHGVGQWHAPWLQAEVGTMGITALRAAAAAFDPEGIMNPDALLCSDDRLEA